MAQYRPHYYNVDYKAKWKKEVGGFGRDERFKYDRQDQDLTERSPGPTTATLDIALPRIASKRCKMNLNLTNSERNISFRTGMTGTIDESRNRFVDSKRIYFRELQKDFQGHDSPGFVYETDAITTFATKQNKSFSFGKVRISIPILS